MFAEGQLVIYGGEGVCRVEKIGPAAIPGADRTRVYYTLAPQCRTGQVLTPVDTPVLMRPVISREEALSFIAALPALPVPEMHDTGVRAVKSLYQAEVSSYDTARLAGLVKLIGRKRAAGQTRGKKPSALDERYLRRAEDLLCGELCAALGEDRSAVMERIRRADPEWPRS